VISADPGLPAIIARSEEFGYDGWYAIEMFNAELWQTPVAEAARACYQSLLPLHR
jgi:2-keto-myo-inositol isomerase